MTREEAIHFAECLKNNWTINFNDMEEFCDMAIEAFKQTAWIPCIERLPAQTGEYLVTVYCTKEVFFVDKFDYMPTSDGWVDPETSVDWNDYVVAWMPLPGPWKGENNEQIH